MTEVLIKLPFKRRFKDLSKVEIDVFQPTYLQILLCRHLPKLKLDAMDSTDVSIWDCIPNFDSLGGDILIRLDENLSKGCDDTDRF